MQDALLVSEYELLRGQHHLSLQAAKEAGVLEWGRPPIWLDLSGGLAAAVGLAGAAAVAAVGLAGPCRLAALDLTGNGLGAVGAKAIAEALAWCAAAAAPPPAARPHSECGAGDDTLVCVFVRFWGPGHSQSTSLDCCCSGCGSSPSCRQTCGSRSVQLTVHSLEPSKQAGDKAHMVCQSRNVVVPLGTGGGRPWLEVNLRTGFQCNWESIHSAVLHFGLDFPVFQLMAVMLQMINARDNNTSILTSAGLRGAEAAGATGGLGSLPGGPTRCGHCLSLHFHCFF